ELDRPEVGLSTAGLLAWNHLRGLAYLAARPRGSADRLGLFALGAGADLAVLLLALDERVAAAALRSDAGYLRDRLQRGKPPANPVTPPGILQAADRPELLGCFAPRPLRLMIESEDPRSVPGEGETPLGAASRGAEVLPWGGFGELVNLYALFH